MTDFLPTPPDRPADTVLTVWVVYERPVDYPQGYVVRPQFARRCGEVAHSAQAWGAPTLEAIREALPPELDLLARSADDDPAIIECWV